MWLIIKILHISKYIYLAFNTNNNLYNTMLVLLSCRCINAQRLDNKSLGVNFTNIIQATYCLKVFCKDFLYLKFGLIFFWWKKIGAKAACKMLMKLTNREYLSIG